MSSTLVPSQLSNVWVWQYVYASCEPHYQETLLMKEFWGVVTSLAFILAAYYGHKHAVTPEAHRAALALVLPGIFSMIHHAYLTWWSQTLDQVHRWRGNFDFFRFFAYAIPLTLSLCS